MGLRELKLGTGLKNLGKGIFYNCKNLNDFDIPEGVEVIDDRAFFGCISLKHIIIPQSVSSINPSAFAVCVSVESISVESDNPVFHSSGNCIIETLTKTIIKGCKTSVIPDDGSVEVIGRMSFFYCDNDKMKSIYIPYGITRIEDMAFSCNGVLKAYIPVTVNYIGGAAFLTPDYVFPDFLFPDDPYYQIQDVYYQGSEDDWNNISFGVYCDNADPSNTIGNEDLFAANIHFNSDAMHDHIYEEVITVISTCTAEGLATYTCSVCGKNYTEVIPVTEHTPVLISTPANCVENGFEYYACKDCGKQLTETQIIPATGIHTWDYTSDFNSITISCKNCDKIYHINAVLPDELICSENPKTVSVEGEIPDYFVANISYITDDGQPPREAGQYLVLFELMNKENSSIVLACSEITMTIEHDLISYEGKMPTCIEDGYDPYDMCNNCNYSTYNAIPATGHTYSSSVTYPTCTKGGYTTYTCHCGRSYIDDYTDALGHDYQPVTTVLATCTQNGQATSKCSKCGDEHTVILYATGHHYSQYVTAPTCIKQGFTTYICDCGYSYKTSYVAALGHSFVNYVYNEDATTEQDGTETAKCERCDETDTRVKPGTKIHVHAYYETVTPPTCTNQGYTTYTCECGDTYNSAYVASLGHSFTNYVYNNDANADKDGTETAKCDRCDVTSTRTKPGTKLTPEAPDTSKTVISAPSGNRDINWRYRAHLVASAVNLPTGYHLAWFENNSNICDKADFTTGSLTSDKTYTVKIVDKAGKSVGADDKNVTVTLKVKNDFITKIISFFSRLFGGDVTEIR